MSQYQTPNYQEQGGSRWIVGSGGTLVVQAGGSVQNSGGQSMSGSVVVSGSLSVTGALGAPNVAIGGTLGRWAFGTAALTSGVGTIATGLTRVITANANAILGEAPGLGSFTNVLVDLSLAAAGSVIFRAAAGTLPYSNNGTLAWSAFGT